jgi:hypothetical protein
MSNTTGVKPLFFNTKEQRLPAIPPPITATFGEFIIFQRITTLQKKCILSIDFIQETAERDQETFSMNPFVR